MRIVAAFMLTLLLWAPALAGKEPRREAALPKKETLPEDPNALPTVTVRHQDNGDVVEEYRENGRLTMVKVTQPSGASYTLFDTNGDGKLDRSDSEGPVGPVYYSIYRWN